PSMLGPLSPPRRPRARAVVLSIPLASSTGYGLWPHTSLQSICELRTGLDVQLAVGVAQVRLDGPAGHEQRLGYLGVRHAVGGELADAQLRGGQRLDARERRPPGARSGCAQLRLGALLERGGQGPVGGRAGRPP